MAERGIVVDHATLNRWVLKFAPLIALEAYRRRPSNSRSWRMDETYVKVRGRWVYLYRAVDKFGKTLNFMLSERRNKVAAIRFFAKALETNGIPEKVVIDKNGANKAGLRSVNQILARFGCPFSIQTIR